MTQPIPHNPDYAARTQDSFSRQGFMKTLGVELTRVLPGRVEMTLPYREALSQQHGYFHGGVIGALADNAGGYAAYTLLRPEDSLLTVEYKINIMAPGKGESLIAIGEVVKPGRRLSVCEAKIYAVANGEGKLCATALCTLMTMENMPDEIAL